MRGRSLSVLAVAIAIAACHSAANELPRERSDSAPSGAASTSDAATGRCFFPTPAAPPAPVPPGPAPGCPPDPAPHTLPLVTVQFPEATGGVATVTAELARSKAESERGLMFRTSMQPDHGMFFDLGERSVHQFWMHDTCIPLDMIFLDEDGFVVGVLENVPTLNEQPRGVPCASSYVLETNAGWARRVGVKAGMWARLPGG